MPGLRNRQRSRGVYNKISFSIQHDDYVHMKAENHRNWMFSTPHSLLERRKAFFFISRRRKVVGITFLGLCVCIVQAITSHRWQATTSFEKTDKREEIFRLWMLLQCMLVLRLQECFQTRVPICSAWVLWFHVMHTRTINFSKFFLKKEEDSTRRKPKIHEASIPAGVDWGVESPSWSGFHRKINVPFYW